jgi:OOP family OmpA-OmpF porin
VTSRAIARCSGFRLEGEVTYRDNNISGLSGGQTGGSVISGNASSLAFMANGYYDIATGSWWTPYIGGGLGLALDHQTINSTPMPGNVVDGTSSELAYQAMAGIGYQITDSLNFAIEYRYFGTTSPTYDLSFPGAPPGLNLNTDYNSTALC